VLDPGELIALRQFAQIVENKSEYEDTLTETIITKKGKSQQVTRPMAPMT